MLTTRFPAGLLASVVHEQERILFFVLIQMALIVVAARVGGALARRHGQPGAVGEIVAGIVLGPTVLGRSLPGVSDFLFHSVDSMPLQVISQLGLLLLMFQIGLDFDFSHLTESVNRCAVVFVSIAGIVLPFALGYSLGGVSAGILAPGINPLGYKLFLASAMSITAVPILGRIMAEFDLQRTRLGTISISAAAINDVVGWLLLAVVSTLVTSRFSGGAFAQQVGLLLLFFAVAWFVVRPLLKRHLRSARVSAEHLPRDVMAAIFVVIILGGLCTFSLGIFAIFGGFVMGVLLFDEPGFVTAWKRRVADFVTVVLLPVFFTFTGHRTDIQGLDSPALWLWCGLVLAVATIGKFLGCYLASRWSGLSHSEAACVGVMMNTRALMELIVINVGYNLGVIPKDVFTMLVIMAVSSTVITAPLLRRWLKKIGHVIPGDRDV